MDECASEFEAWLNAPVDRENDPLYQGGGTYSAWVDCAEPLLTPELCEEANALYDAMHASNDTSAEALLIYTVVSICPVCTEEEEAMDQAEGPALDGAIDAWQECLKRNGIS